MNINELSIRTVSANDAQKLLDIYAPYVLNTAITFEYEVPSLNEFKGRIEQTLRRYPYIAAISDNEISGYAYASSFKQRAAYDWAVETSIYVKNGYHGKGIGKILYTELERILKLQNIINLNACIAYPNPQSIAFHEKSGYKKTAHFTKCGFKNNKWYDMVWLEKFIGSHTVPPKPFIPYSELRDQTL